jgi:hypothetical protein
MAHARSADDSTDSRALAAGARTASLAEGQAVLIATPTDGPGQPALVRTSRDRKLAYCRCCLDLLEQLLTDSPLLTRLRTELDNAPGIPNHPPIPRTSPTDSLGARKLRDHRRRWAK